MALLNLLASSTPDAPVTIVINRKEPFPVRLSKLNFTLIGLIVVLLVVILVGVWLA